MTSAIKLGYEIKSGAEVFIQPTHLIVTGITQLSGKTTTLEALIHRSQFRAIVFKTKIGEKSFTHGTEIAPFFRDRSDYEFVRSLIEAYAKEKLSIEKGSLMTLCKGSGNLIEIKKRVDDAIAGGKLRGIKEEIYTRLQHYLENLIPQIQYGNLSRTLNIVDGINIMNLERYSEEAQSLIIQSTANEVLLNLKDTIIVIPEAWKFIPQKYNNPCKRVIESFIRQGATNKNFVWIDSQDMAGVDKQQLKSVATWILGFQSERNEVAHTLDQINLPKKNKPKEEDIMSLKLGEFFLSSPSGVSKVYVQPAWMDDKDAELVSLGGILISDIVKNIPLSALSIMPKENLKFDSRSGADGQISILNKKLIETRNDFFNKIGELTEDIRTIKQHLFLLESKPSAAADTDEIVSIVLQKLPKLPEIDYSKIPSVPEFDINKILKEVMKAGGFENRVYEVAPLEKIKIDFLEEIKNKIISDISSLSAEDKKVLRYFESLERDIAPGEIITKCLLIKSGGSASTKVSNILKTLLAAEVIEKTAGARYRKALRKRIEVLMENHSAPSDQIDAAYNHLLNFLI